MNNIKMNDQEKNNADPFEDGLRQILSSDAQAGERPAAGEPAAQSEAAKQKRAERMEAERIEAEKRAESERRLLFWLKLLRPVALVALLGLMALFVHIIVTWGN
jgi:hypothetical protein